MIATTLNPMDTAVIPEPESDPGESPLTRAPARIGGGISTSSQHLQLSSSVLLRSSREKLWPLLSDTEVVNRRLGLGPVQYRPLEGEGAARYEASSRQFGLALFYAELPFEWEAPGQFSVCRVFASGPVRRFELRFELEEVEEGTQARTTFIADLRSAWFKPLFRVILEIFIGRYNQVCRDIDAQLQQKRGPASAQTIPLTQGALSHLRPRLADFEPTLVDHLLSTLSGAPDHDLQRIRPFEWADAWGADREKVLALCLEATSQGLLELRWDLVCPSCQTASERLSHLSELTAQAHCHACDLHFDSDLATSVEVTFRPHPSIRTLDESVYCLAGPARFPQVLSQRIIEAGGCIQLHAPGQAGRYRLSARGGARAVLVVGEGGPPQVEIRLLPGQIEPPTVMVAPGALLTLHNDAPSDRHFRIERHAWSSRAATGQHVVNLPRFRRLFSHEALSPGVLLNVSQLTFLFSDLVGSTAMYEELGDAAAYRVVADHFVVLRNAIEVSHGTVIKTMGDAVMASFNRTADAVAAAALILKDFKQFQATHSHGQRVDIKLGVHSGPSYVVTANGSLDYFGQTVNTAARIQAQSGPGELLMTQVLAEDEEVALQLTHMREVERLDRLLKGMSTPTALVRFKPVEES